MINRLTVNDSRVYASIQLRSRDEPMTPKSQMGDFEESLENIGVLSGSLVRKVILLAERS
jgi:hypothetical protein